METLRESSSIVVARPADDLYEMVADVTRMGDWSPVCKACWWNDGGGPQVGATFTGRNELPERIWETTSEVVAAAPGKEFAFVVTATGTRWGYTFSPVEGGTEITESWEFPEQGFTVLAERFPDDAEAQVANRQELARTGMAATLAAIKKAAEAA